MNTSNHSNEKHIETLFQEYKPDAVFSPEVRSVIRRMLIQKTQQNEVKTIGFFQYISSFFVGSALTAAFTILFLQQLDHNNPQFLPSFKSSENNIQVSQLEEPPLAPALLRSADMSSSQESQNLIEERSILPYQSPLSDTTFSHTLQNTSPLPLYTTENTQLLFSETSSLITPNFLEIQHINLRSTTLPYTIDFQSNKQEIHIYRTDNHPRTLTTHIDEKEAIIAVNTLLESLGIQYTIQSLEILQTPYDTDVLTFIEPYRIDNIFIYDVYTGEKQGIRIQFGAENTILSIGGIRTITPKTTKNISPEVTTFTGKNTPESIETGYVFQYDPSSTQEYIVPATILRNNEHTQIIPYTNLSQY